MPTRDIMVRDVDTDLLRKQAHDVETAMSFLPPGTKTHERLEGLWEMLHRMLDQVE